MNLRKNITLHLCKKMVEANLSKDVNSACRFWIYQDKVPEKVKEKFRKE